MPRALVTGAFGFVGRAMVKELKARGWSVGGWDLPSWDVHTMVRDFGALDVDLLVHCAYHVGGRAAIDGTNINMAKNVALDADIFKFAVESGEVGSVLYFSSSAAYPLSLQNAAYHQRLYEDAINLAGHESGSGFINQPDGRYGFAKLVGERLAEDVRAAGVPVTVVRPFSGYGVGQSDDYPFPSIVKRALKKDLTVWGPPGQTRDWIHISDVVNGALAVWEQQRAWVDIDDKPLSRSATEPVNLCTGVGTTMGELMHMAYRYAHGEHPGKISYDMDKPTGVAYRVGDPSRMMDYYEPKIKILDGIREAVDAYRRG